MKYHWEKKVSQETLDYIHEFLFAATGLTLAGVAVCNTDTGEAALILDETGASGVIEADCRQDILGDAQKQYAIAAKKIMETN